MNKSFKPGELLGMMKTHPRKAYKKAMSSMNLHTSHTGSFHGKSNALGHGGRAAQLKARGVPGGVIGNLARAAHAAPGQANYHGKHSHKKKVAPLQKQELGMAMKHAHKKKSAMHVIHVHHHGSGHVHVHMKGSTGLVGQAQEHKELSGMKREKHAHKHYKKAHKGKFGDEKEEGLGLEHREEGADKFKKSHKHSGSMCKHSSHKRKASGKRRLASPQIATQSQRPIPYGVRSAGGAIAPFANARSGGAMGGQSTVGFADQQNRKQFGYKRSSKKKA